jgi:bifunctional DNase/RNase
MIRVVIDSVRVNLMSQHRVVVLREENGNRYLPIWIGPFEADSITIELQGVPMARPLTHDLLKSILDELHVGVAHVVVSDLLDDTFYARIVLEVDGLQKDIDSRPSDAIALAVRTKVPIYVSRHVMDEAAIMPESEAETCALTGEEMDENLSVFREFLEDLDGGETSAKGAAR